MSFNSEPALDQYITELGKLSIRNLQYHPSYAEVIRSIMSNLRNKKTPPRRFRILTQQLYELIYPILLNWLPKEEVEITTGNEVAYEGLNFSSAKILFIEIPRAGTTPTTKAMDFFHQVAYSSGVDYEIHRGVVDISRVEEGEEVGHETKSVEVPGLSGEVYGVMLDPMLATGGTMEETIWITNKEIEGSGGRVKKLFLGSHIAVPQGIDKVAGVVNEKEISSLMVCGTIDPELDENAYIIPGYGDAGDRQYNT